MVVVHLLTFAAALFVWLAQTPQRDKLVRSFDVNQSSDVRVVVRAGCGRCDWSVTGREAVALRISVDGTYSQHLLLTRGESPADYEVGLGTLAPGWHQLTIERDPELSARDAGPASIDIARTDLLEQGRSDDFTSRAMAPILYARPNTVGKFTDVPVLMWYEVVPTLRGRQFRYSVIFTNEDGGTATDRLMATWGRTTDIEFVYGVEVDPAGRVMAEEFQGPGHEVPPFNGRHEGTHPLLWISTDNNMVSESGPATVRYAPAPERMDLTNVSREVVMDRHPWSYAVAAQEMQREGKILETAAPGSGKIPDPRRFVFVEACTDLPNGAAVAFSVRATERGTPRWYDSDRGLSEFRIVRDGCFRGALPLPPTSSGPDGIRFRAYLRPPQKGEAAVPVPTVVQLTRVNKMFMLAEDYLPRESEFLWAGLLELPVNGDWREPRR